MDGCCSLCRTAYYRNPIFWEETKSPSSGPIMDVVYPKAYAFENDDTWRKVRKEILLMIILLQPLIIFPTGQALLYLLMKVKISITLPYPCIMPCP